MSPPPTACHSGRKRGGAGPQTPARAPRVCPQPPRQALPERGFTQNAAREPLPRPRPSCPATPVLARLGPEFSGADLKVPLSPCSSGRAAARSLLWDMARRDGSTAEEEQCGVTFSLPGSAGPGEEHSSATAAAFSPRFLPFQFPLSAQLTSLWRKGLAAAGGGGGASVRQLRPGLPATPPRYLGYLPVSLPGPAHWHPESLAPGLAPLLPDPAPSPRPGFPLL